MEKPPTPAVIREFILSPVTSVETAKAYVDALCEHVPAFAIGDDIKQHIQPGSFTHDEALIAADRVERLSDYLPDPRRYMAIADARREWAVASIEDILSEFTLFAQSPDTRSDALSYADMVALLERMEPNGDYEDLDSGQLMELMNHFGKDDVDVPA